MSNNLTRVILVALVALVASTQAGMFGFGGSDDAEPPRRKRRQQQEDTVEDYPNYDQERQDRRDRRQQDVSQSDDADSKDSSKSRRSKMAEIRRNRAARDRDEMVSQEFNQNMLNDEEMEETHTPEENPDGYLTDEDINRIWQEHMHDFVPEDMMNVIVEHKSTEALFETINHLEPTTIKGAYYVLKGNESKTISCIIYDPNREIVYKRKGSAQGILLFDSTVPGEYAIIFSNMESGEDLTVTLALHTYEDKEDEIKYDITSEGLRYEVKEKTVEEARDEILGGTENMAASEEEIGEVRGQLRKIQVSVKQIQSEAKLSMMRQNGHNEDLLENQDWNFYFMLVEVACFFGIVAFQTHHIKKLLDNKLIL